ncbi:MAG: TIGR02597 family protein [Chthoniobacteraceae bacterium]
MKTNTSLLRHLSATAALVLAAASQMSFAQTTATTDPVGFVTLTIAGGGTPNNPKLTLVSPTLTQPIAWQGIISGITGNTISVANNPWTVDQFNGAVNGLHYVEIISLTTPTKSGALSDITGTTTGSVTTFDNLTAYAVVGDTIKIRKHVTIGSLFGVTNSAGLLATNDPTTADEVFIYDGSSSVPYFYYTGDVSSPAGWYDSAFSLNPGDAAKVDIGPHQGVVIKRKASASVTMLAQGAVKTGNTIFPVTNGLNVLGTVSAKGLTLGGSGLFTNNPATGVKATDDPTTADEVLIYTATGPTPYFYYTGDVSSPAGWYDSAFTFAADLVAIAPGTAFVLKRKGGGSFNWTLPSPSSF